MSSFTADYVRSLDNNLPEDFIQEVIESIEGNIRYRNKCGYSDTDIELEAGLVRRLFTEFNTRGFVCRIEKSRLYRNRSILYIKW